jgi:hypothetical protein
MRHPLVVLVVAATIVALVGAVTRAKAADAGVADGGAAGCIESWPEARMQAYGYNHIVHIRDTCAVAADCIVTTDVNPEPTPVAVAAKSETEINTYLGSPARVFTPKVVCTMHTC